MPASVLFCLLGSASASLLPDAIAIPRAKAPWQRPPDGLLLHLAGVANLAALLLMLSARPVFAALTAISLVALLAIVSNAKHESLREPLVFSDLSLFSQSLRHPRLYLPFLSGGKVAALVLGVLAFAGMFFLDKPLNSVPYLALALTSVCCITVVALLSASLKWSLDLTEDQQRHGFFTTFVAYLFNGLHPKTRRQFLRTLATGPFATASCLTKRPDVIVIQSESFFDARRLGPNIHSHLLAHFDAACAESAQQGRLSVPAWGANTMRTEFALLSGLPESRTGYTRYYPYAFVRQACATLASWFKTAGYRTFAIHPYHADFFGRKRVFRHMGFEHFDDIASFTDAPCCGPYVADSAVADAVIAKLESSGNTPCFVMAITMENHGPLHLEQVGPGEYAAYHELGEGEAWNDLTAYLRHLANADAMIGRLTEYLRQRERETVLCFYGDHVPALPRVYEQIGKQPSESDYFIWRNDGVGPARQVDLAASQLGQELVASMMASEAA